MSVDEAIAAAVRAELAPILEELRAARIELAGVRASLPPRFVSMKTAAEALDVDVQTVSAMFHRGEILGRKAGRRVLIDAASLRAYAGGEIASLARKARMP